MKNTNENEIKRVRSLLGLSQQALAEEIEHHTGVRIKKTAIGNYETKERTPRPDIALAFVNYASSRGIPTSLEKIYADKIPNQH